MPITYPRSSPARPSYLAHVSDADDSIVLSDLVRSGEVSRLRRRGAIAIRDMTVPPSPVLPTLPASPPLPTTSGMSMSRHSSVSLPPLPQPHPEPDLSETDDDDVEQRQGGVGRWFFRSRLNLRELSTSDFNDSDPLLFPQEAAEVRLEDDDEDSSHVLFCGGRLRESEWYGPGPLNVSRPPDSPPRHRASAFRPQPPLRRPSHQRARRTNGCGALIHVNAQPRRRQGTWVACGVAAETVVRMDARYFDCCSAVKIIKSACGGNPLGIIYVPCQAAADGLSIPRASSSASSSTGRTQPAQGRATVHQLGPDHWLHTMDTRQRRRDAAKTEIFNFFSDRVRSAPEFAFPSPPPQAEVLPSRLMQPLSPGSLTTAPQRLSGSSIPEPIASRQWTDRFSMPSVDNIQDPDSLWGGPPGEAASDNGNVPQEDEVEGDNAEKPEDSGPIGSGQILWAER
ncbi:hypothetical protein BC826DRAFT_965518 [Russula brevipes]|nr:hypothetical protein BC826DRAFT_965518 [Russula brevipes]